MLGYAAASCTRLAVVPVSALSARRTCSSEPAGRIDVSAEAATERSHAIWPPGRLGAPSLEESPGLSPERTTYSSNPD